MARASGRLPDRAGAGAAARHAAWTIAAALALWPGGAFQVREALGQQPAPPRDPLLEVSPPAGPVVTLSLEDAVDRALVSRQEVALARARLAAAEAALRGARAELSPRFVSLLGYTRTFRSIFPDFATPADAAFMPDPTLSLEQRVRRLEEALAAGLPLGPGFDDAAFPLGLPHAWLAAVTADYTVYAGGERGARIRAAQRRVESARLALREVEADVALEARLAYDDAVLAEALVALARASLELAAEHLALAETRFREGAVPELDVLRAGIEYDNLRPQLVDALDAYHAARLRLAAAADLPLDARPVLTTGLCPAPAADSGPEHLPPPAEADAVIAAGPRHMAARMETAAREAEVRAAAAAFRPVVDVFGNLGWQAFPESPVPGPGDWRADWFAGFEIRFPLHLGGRRRAALERAGAEAAVARADAARLLEAGRADYRRWLGEAERAWVEATARRGTVARAERVLELVRLRYEEGVAIQIELLDARLAVDQARGHLVRSAHAYRTAVARAEHALGWAAAVRAGGAAACPAPSARVPGSAPH